MAKFGRSAHGAKRIFLYSAKNRLKRDISATTVQFESVYEVGHLPSLHDIAKNLHNSRAHKHRCVCRLEQSRHPTVG